LSAESDLVKGYRSPLSDSEREEYPRGGHFHPSISRERAANPANLDSQPQMRMILRATIQQLFPQI
jgi:hypothetical protein